MKKEELVALGLTDEQADQVLAENGKDVGKALKKSGTDAEELKRLKAIEAELEVEKNAKLSAEEKLNNAIEAANAEKISFAKEKNKLAVEKILVSAGLTEDDYKNFIDGIITENSEFSESLANGLVGMLTKQRELTESTIKEKLLDSNPLPPGSGANEPNGKTDAETFAETIAKTSVDSNKSTQSVLSHYTGGN